MSYKPLKSFFHQAQQPAAAAVDHELAARLNGPSTIRFNYRVGDFDLFVVLTTELATLVERVWTNELHLSRLWSALPGAAQDHYLFSLLVDEIQSTNEIENIHSTLQEVSEALEAARSTPSNSAVFKRFQEMARSYLALFDESPAAQPPTSLQDLRQLYDSLLADEISPEDQLDGELFRAGPVSIFDAGHHEPIHRGAATEADIHGRLTAMLGIHSAANVPSLAGAFIEHFMLEHTHPFYDGNGRFGRFLLALRLRHVLSSPTALSLSAGIMREKNAYYKAFLDAEHPLNRGEATFFLERMLKILVHAQEARQEFLHDKRASLHALGTLMAEWADNNPHGLSDYEKKTLFLLGQIYMFGPRRGANWDEIASFLGRSKQTVRPALDSLEQRGFIVKLSNKPLVVGLTERGVQLLHLDAA
ncbi:Fic family protein [Corynebacterium sp.]|uniref:Fic family protein n=1 Tax=Corynebacterium sp. TaxID=1720 RepID=UPI0037353BE7